MAIGARGFEPLIMVPKTIALPLGYTPGKFNLNQTFIIQNNWAYWDSNPKPTA